MKSHNADNERLKRRYITYLKEARGHSEASIDAVAMALHRFECDTSSRDFGAFRLEQAATFKRHLAEQKNARTGKALSKATLNSASCRPTAPTSIRSSSPSRN